MALSLLLKIDGSCSSSALGNLQLGSQIAQDNDGRKLETSVSGHSQEEKKDPPQEIRVTLENPNDVFSELWQLNQKHPTLHLVELKIIPSEIASKTGRAWVRKEGKISYDCNWVQEKGIRKCEPKYFLNFPRKSSTYKRRIFRGFHEYNTPVAIERIEMSNDTIIEIEREFRILQELEIHENFIRYFSYETDERAEFVFIATELCLCSVDDLFQDNQKISLKKEVLSSLTAKGILFQATRGLDYLHQNHFVHRNVKPSSFLIKEIQSRDGTRFAIKITDFRLTRQLDPSKDLSGSAASDGWEAPESKKEKQALRQSLDIFILGCFYHYLLTGTDQAESKPRHPFGDSELTRLGKIPNLKTDVYQKKWTPKDIKDEKAIELIKKMIKYNESERPKLTEVLNHEYFKPANKDYYPIYDYPIPGLCVIFNQEHFRTLRLPYREGSGQDWRRLNSTFEKLGFKVVVHHNLMSFDLKGEIKKLAVQDFSKCGCLVLCFLSHGIENAIAGSDGKWININKLKYKFSYNHCQSLYGKPKIFVVQACQGELEQNMTGIVPLSIRKTDSSPQVNESTVELSTASSAIKYITSSFKTALFPYETAPDRNPPIMDFIAIKSTIPGFVSLRNSLTGTYFIQAFCQKLEEEYIDNKTTDYDNFHDLEHIMRGEGGVQSIVNSKILKSQYRQTVSWEAYLSKYIRFRSVRRDVEDKIETDFEDGSSADIFAQKYFYVPPDYFEYESKPEEASPTE